MRWIVDTSPKERLIVDTSPTEPKLDPAMVVAALGAEAVGPMPAALASPNPPVALPAPTLPARKTA